MKFTSGMYRFLAPLLLPLAKLYLLKRAKKQPAYRDHWDERFGTAQYPVPSRPRLWLHAVSVGETNAAKSLIAAFLTEQPEAEILLTCMTPTGRDVGERIAKSWPGRIVQCYLPYDTPRLMGAFLDQTRPNLGIIMETEVWPTLMHEAKKRAIPMILANARESEKSQQKAKRVIDVMRPAFAAFSVVLAQSEKDAERLAALGATNLKICGSVKFDIRPDSSQVAQAQCVRKMLGRSVVLMASTRQDEEKMFVEHLDKLPKDSLVLLVPRHPQRFEEIADMLLQAGVRFLRKSRMKDWSEVRPDIRLILGDTMGEMSFNCAMGDVCIMGGSFGNFGCQNLIEPAAAHVPVIVGPSSYNFAKPVDDAVHMGAACRVTDARQAMEVATQWLTDGRLADRRQAAGTFADSYTGATECMMCEIRRIWDKVTA